MFILSTGLLDIDLMYCWIVCLLLQLNIKPPTKVKYASLLWSAAQAEAGSCHTEALPVRTEQPSWHQNIIYHQSLWKVVHRQATINTSNLKIKQSSYLTFRFIAGISITGSLSTAALPWSPPGFELVEGPLEKIRQVFSYTNFWQKTPPPLSSVYNRNHVTAAWLLPMWLSSSSPIPPPLPLWSEKNQTNINYCHSFVFTFS